MPQKFWRVILIMVLSLSLAAPGRAETITAARDQIVIGIVVVGAAITVLAVLLVHKSHKETAITGCIAATANGMSLTDEKEKQVYALSGNPAGARAGERMTLEGKRRSVNQMPVFEARSVTRDLGACQP
jgi:hypothetical protein